MLNIVSLSLAGLVTIIITNLIIINLIMTKFVVFQQTMLFFFDGVI